MNLNQLSQSNPTWTLEEFVDVANRLFPQYLPEVKENQRVSEEINSRLVRNYTSQGLLDEPSRQGKYAIYHYRHLLQILVVRRLLSEGIGLGAIAPLIQTKTNAELEHLLRGGIQIQVSPANPALAYLQDIRDQKATQPSTPAVEESPSPESTWYRLEVIPGIEIHINADFHYPNTPSGKQLLKQKVVETLENFKEENMIYTKKEIDLTGLKWIKNINHQDSSQKWAYPNPPEIAPGCQMFRLSWSNATGNEANADKLKAGELILLKQLGSITHLVRVIDNGVQHDLNADNTQHNYNLFRVVEVVWMTSDWDNPPTVEEVCQCNLELPGGGKAVAIENKKEFQEYWNDSRGGLTGLQEHIRSFLNLG